LSDIKRPEADWDRIMRINVKGVFLCSQAVAAHMVKNKHGRIINVASGRGLAGQPRAAHYAASKAAVIGFTKSLAMELAPANVTVNAIAPGATDTPMARAGSTDEEWKRREAVPPLMGGLTKKEEIVGLRPDPLSSVRCGEVYNRPDFSPADAGRQSDGVRTRQGLSRVL
jgi:3-oxoacyl-[acyl-carrier protein] reductase